MDKMMEQKMKEEQERREEKGDGRENVTRGRIKEQVSSPSISPLLSSLGSPAFIFSLPSLHPEVTGEAFSSTGREASTFPQLKKVLHEEENGGEKSRGGD